MAGITGLKRAQVARQGFWGWLLQRLTGVMLLFFLSAHLFYLHYALEWPITFRDVANSLFLRVVDIGILVLVVYHALYGIRTALLNLGIGASAQRVMAPSLLLIGGVMVVFGVLIFWFLLRG